MVDKKFIESQKRSIEKDLARLEDDVKRGRKFSDIGSTNEDNALEFEAFEENLALSKNAIREVKELRRALKKIEKGTYGICQKCGRTIERGRLKAYPAAAFCATHAKEK